MIDVGVSGGIDYYWRFLGAALNAVGFDPLVKEIERLRAAETNPRIRYECAYVVGPERHGRMFQTSEVEDILARKDNSSIARSSSFAALEAMGEDYAHNSFPGIPMEFSDSRVRLDDYVERQGIPFVDFVKTDTEGQDFDVLLGAQKMLTSKRVLGVCVEASFHGKLNRDSGIFSNIDLFLHSQGYSLYDLEINRYSRRNLPARFVHRFPASTVSGQVQWADALYFRDFGNPNYEKMFSIQPTAPEVIKLTCLFEMFGLLDCAAELLVLYRGLIDPICPVDRLLDELVSETHPTYLSYIDAFRRDPKTFYPSVDGLNEKDEKILKLQKEFQDRTEWALRLDREVKEKDERILKLQKEFDERTEWALRLDREVKERDERILRLQKELKHREELILKLQKSLDAPNGRFGLRRT